MSFWRELWTDLCQAFTLSSHCDETVMDLNPRDREIERRLNTASPGIFDVPTTGTLEDARFISNIPQPVVIQNDLIWGLRHRGMLVTVYFRMHDFDEFTDQVTSEWNGVDIYIFGPPMPVSMLEAMAKTMIDERLARVEAEKPVVYPPAPPNPDDMSPCLGGTRVR